MSPCVRRIVVVHKTAARDAATQTELLQIGEAGYRQFGSNQRREFEVHAPPAKDSFDWRDRSPDVEPSNRKRAP